MNITDVDKLDQEITEDSFQFLYNKQYDLYLKYKEIEEMPKSYPLNLNVSDHQSWIKDFMWRVTEELVEFLEAFELKDNTHKIDELSDALHFFMEIYVLLGKSDLVLDAFISKHKYNSINSFEEAKRRSFKIIESLAWASNMLKNRKWKKTQVLIDEYAFYVKLNHGFFKLIDLILNSFTYKENNKNSLLNLYYLKNQVNHFRTRSNY